MRLIAPSRWTVRMAGAALAVALAAASVRAQSLDVLPASGEWVTDRADLLTPTQRTALSARLDAFEDSTSNQIVVVILPTLNGADAGQYATELGQRWGVGQGQRDNGIVVLVSVEDRQLFIAPGYGLEGAVPDVVAGRIVRNVMVPRFREGRFYEGIDAGVTALMAATRGEYEALPAARPTGVNPVVVFAAMLAVIFLVGRLLQRGGDDDGRRRRRRRYGGPNVIFLPGGWGGGWGGGGGGFSGGFGGGGFGGFSGGGGGFGGGGAGGSW